MIAAIIKKGKGGQFPVYLTYGKHNAENMPKIVKTKSKTYPDGSIKHIVYSEIQISHAGENTQKSSGLSSSAIEKLSLQELQEKREYERLKKTWQVKDKIKDYCLSNDFDYFWTLTFNENRSDDEICFSKMQKWLKRMRAKYGTFNYIFIPERHKDGSIHFHGVTGGFKGKIVDSGVRHRGHIVFNCVDYDYGFTTLSAIRDRKKCASYVTKYVTKDLMNTPVEKGKKKYWCSRGLRLPVVTYSENNLCVGKTPDWKSEDGRVSIYNS